MSGLLFEAHVRGTWVPLATLTPSDRAGSVTSNTLDGRDVIMFHCCDGHSVVERSVSGADETAGTVRVVTTEGTETLARLTAGQSYEADLVSDRGIAYKARWTHV